MNWFALRQQRKTFLVFVVILAGIAAFTIPTGLHYWHSYQHALATCNLTSSCDSMDTLVFGSGSGQFVKNIVFAVGLFAPLLLGLFMGAPLLAREYEEGTDQLAWTQSVSRRKWLTVKLAWALVFALLYGIIVTLLTTWWSRTTNAVYQNRFDPGVFDVQGLMPVANSLLFTAVGFTLGAWFRKTVLSMAVVLGVFVGLQVAFPNLIRPHYAKPVTVTSPMGPDQIFSKIPQGATWVLTRNIVDKNGRVFASFDAQNMPPQCQKLIESGRLAGNSRVIAVKPGGPGSIDDCLNAAGYHQTASYQPSYRYWDFQRAEAGIYLGIAAVATAAAYWLVLRRDA